MTSSWGWQFEGSSTTLRTIVVDVAGTVHEDGERMNQLSRTLLFLPGISGHGDFWRPVAEQLQSFGRCVLLDWPGFGGNPAAPTVNGYEDLVDLVLAHAACPTVLIAQSMGGYVALRAALAAGRAGPGQVDVTHLVLAATSGGVDVSRFGALDWRPETLQAQPGLPAWATEAVPDLAEQLAQVRIPCLLVWASDDPISPLAVGEHLQSLLPDARLVVYEGDDHWVARIEAVAVAREIIRLLDSSGEEHS